MKTFIVDGNAFADTNLVAILLGNLEGRLDVSCFIVPSRGSLGKIVKNHENFQCRW
jgi:hypothetical protein